jgi:hypothetical protein
MKYNLTSPCSDCPFLRTDGAVRLTRSRIKEIAGGVLRRIRGSAR